MPTNAPPPIINKCYTSHGLTFTENKVIQFRFRRAVGWERFKNFKLWFNPIIKEL